MLQYVSVYVLYQKSDFFIPLFSCWHGDRQLTLVVYDVEAAFSRSTNDHIALLGRSVTASCLPFP